MQMPGRWHAYKAPLTNVRRMQSRKWFASSTSDRLRALSVRGRNLLLAGGLRGDFKEEVTLNQILKDGVALQMQRKGG